MFATHSTFGVLDLGASKTVIGADNVKGLIEGLDPIIRKGLSRCGCDVTFRFGNQGTLNSTMALVIPIGRLQLKVAVVPGNTPFLISNTLMRTLAAQIDCQCRQFSSAMLDKPIQMHLTNRGLFLVDLNEIALSARRQTLASRDSAKPVTETYLSAVAPGKIEADQITRVAARVAEIEDKIQQQTAPDLLTCHSTKCTDRREQSPKGNHLRGKHDDNKSNHHQVIPIHDSSDKTAQEDIPERTVFSIASQQPHDSEPALESLAAERPGRSGRSQPLDTEGLGGRSDHLWQQVQWPDPQSGLARSGMVPVHAVSIRQQHEEGTSSNHPVHRTQDRAPRAEPDSNPEGPEPNASEPKSDTIAGAKDKSSGQGQGIPSPPRSPCWSEHAKLFARPSGVGRRGVGIEFRDVCPGDHDADTLAARSRLPGNEGSPSVHGECSAASDSAPRSRGDSGRSSSERLRGMSIENSFTMTHRDATHVQKLIRQFSQELYY